MDSYGPALPPGILFILFFITFLIYHFVNLFASSVFFLYILYCILLGFILPADESSESDSEQCKKKAKVIGPQIPDFLTSKQLNDGVNSPVRDESQSSKIIGPVIPSSCTKSSNSDNEDSEVYGPMPPQTKIDYDVVGMIEKRAASMKNKLDNKVFIHHIDFTQVFY